MPELSVQGISQLGQPLGELFLLSSRGRESSAVEQLHDPFGYLLGTEAPLITEIPTGSSSLIEEIYDALKYLQKNMGIHIEKPDEVVEYLRWFPDMVSTTKKVAEVARRKLPDAHLYLELYRDPEIEDEHLVLYARFRNYDSSVMDKIREVWRGYSELLVGKRGWILLTTDFNPVE